MILINGATGVVIRARALQSSIYLYKSTWCFDFSNMLDLCMLRKLVLSNFKAWPGSVCFGVFKSLSATLALLSRGGWTR